MSGHLGKQEIYDLLTAKGVPYEKLEHIAVYTVEEMDAAGVGEKGLVCKNLFLRDAKGKNHYLVTVPENRRVDLKDLASRLGSTKLSFASEERLETYLGLQKGSVTPLGALNDDSRTVTVVFDAALEGKSAVGVHPNDNTATVWLNFSDLRLLIEEHGNPVVLVGI